MLLTVAGYFRKLCRTVLSDRAADHGLPILVMHCDSKDEIIACIDVATSRGVPFQVRPLSFGPQENDVVHISDVRELQLAIEFCRLLVLDRTDI